MNSGIYLLQFGNLYRYVGQAIDIDARVSQHMESFRRNKAASKLQAAYRDFGEPDVMVICNCHKDHLDALEAYYIRVFDDTFNLNTSKPTPTFSFVSDEVLDILQESTEEICDSLLSLGDTAEDLSRKLVDARAEVVELERQRTEEEIQHDISEKIITLLGEKEDLQSDVDHYKDWIKTAVNLPWYKKIFLKAP